MGGLSNKYKGLSGVEATGGGGGGTGDVVGPSSATANALARYNLTTGKLIKNSSIIVDDSGNVTGINNLSLSGNQTFSGVGKKILADFSNATRANRLAFQTSTLNGNTRVPILPNGTSRLTGIDCFDGTDADNASFLQVHSDGTNNHAGLNSAKIGTGTTKDLVFQIDGVTKTKVNAADGKFNVDTLTASLLVGTDASKNLQSVTVATSSVGTDFAANYSGSTLTLSIPNAGAGIDRGLITNLAQTIAGAKTFSSVVKIGDSNSNPQLLIEANRPTNLNNVSFELRNTNATSNKVQVTFGGGTVASGLSRTFSFGVDIGGVGVKDFFTYNGNTGNTPFIITPTDRVIIGNLGIAYTDAGFRLDVLGTARVQGILKQLTYTVATLPSASTSGVGAMSFVTDALAPVFGATVAGGGAVPVPVFSDGTNWKVG